MKRLSGMFWALLFLAVPVLGVATFAVAPSINVWLPKDVSAHGEQIDSLFYFILALTGVVFIATEVMLFWFMWKYDASARQGEKATYIHGSHTLEVVWTIIPAATLLFLAIYQMNAWANVKMRRPDMPPTVEVVARQFEWRLRYPGRDGLLGTPDDLHLQGHRDRQLGHRLCRALRLGPLQDEGADHLRDPARVRRLARAEDRRAGRHPARSRGRRRDRRQLTRFVPLTTDPPRPAHLSPPSGDLP
jgi:hypothetical protein